MKTMNDKMGDGSMGDNRIGDYTMEELLPVVAALTAKYTGNESTSVTYEKAEQLMGAVVYCIQELNGYAVATTKKMDAKQAYELGYQKVLWKIERTRLFYNEMIVHFNAYGNENYRDTVAKGIPGFFKLYDPKFAPQDSIISMDYPTIRKMGKRTGIDAIERYLYYIALEQKFLGALSEDYVIGTLTAYQEDYRRQFYNICGIVLRGVLIRLLKQSGVQIADFRQDNVREKTPENRAKLEQMMTDVLEKLIDEHYKGDRNLLNYLKSDIKDIGAELTEGYGIIYGRIGGK